MAATPGTPLTETEREVLAVIEASSSIAEAARTLDKGRSYVSSVRTKARQLERMDPALIGAMNQIGATEPDAIGHAWIKTKDPETGNGVSVFLRAPKLPERQPEDITEAIAAGLRRFTAKAPKIHAPRRVLEDQCVIYPRPDFHIGMRSWGRETGADWDLDRAIQELGDAASWLASSAPPAHTGVVLGLGDYYHADDSRDVTPSSGHKLDVDGRYAKVLEAGAWLEIAKVKLALERHQEVIYRCLPGNHDPHASRALALAVKMFFHGHDRITVDDSPSLRWYWSWGRCLFGAGHGHTFKGKDVPMMMANEHPDWSNAEQQCRWFFSGHLHHREAKFEHGVYRLQLAAPGPQDAYAAGGPWASDRGLEAFFFDRHRGYTGSTSYGF